MKDTIPISVDDRRFTIGEWLGFLGLFTTLVFFFALYTVGLSAGIWGSVWVGDFTKTDLIWAVGLTSIAGFPWLAFCGLCFFFALSDKPFTHGSVLLDSRAGRLNLKRRHITGFTFRKSLALDEIRDLSVEWTKGEDGNYTPKLQLIPNGVPVHSAITNPADAADLAAFATRLRTELAAAGWSDPSQHGSPQR